MDLNHLFTDKRLGKNETSSSAEIRTAFQRDFDRIIFSSAFRRLQNKTQVFPLPGSVFVHNRLTHSLEVASVGRTLGTIIGEWIAKEYKDILNPISAEFYKYSMGNVLQAACLCHDIGNPAFGHSGEDAIATFFTKHQTELEPLMTVNEWHDLIKFEGNANSIRILTQNQNGKSEGGLLLTYTTLASIAKYPCESLAQDKKYLERKKLGFFQTEKNIFQDICKHTQMLLKQNFPIAYLRHPFVWLVEVADDICYLIIDLEDAHRLGFVGHDICSNLLKELITELQPEAFQNIEKKLNQISDLNDKISYLRAKAINILIQHSVEIYKNHFEEILTDNLSTPILQQIKNQSEALVKIQNYSETHIYQHRSVVSIENAGYHVMKVLLGHFIPSVILPESDRKNYDKKALQLMPKQFHYPEKSSYEQIMGVLDFISGMTDNYATDLYRKIQGIDIGMTV